MPGGLLEECATEPMGTMRTLCRAAAAVIGAGFLASCTIDDRFLLDDPEPEVTLEALHAVEAPGDGACAAGTTVYWGQARNTGDVFLYEVSAVIDAFGPGGGLLGRFTGGVFSGTGDAANPDTTLDLEQQGYFTVCTSLPWGAAERAEVRFEFVVFEPEE